MDGKRNKNLNIEVLERKQDGGDIIISTGTLDRDKDRVLPSGAQLNNYMKNPVVQYGHNYGEPWTTVGRTNQLKIVTGEKSGIKADFTLRPAANENDPQNIVRLLWSGDWIRTASIGFLPNYDKAFENEDGGFDFTEWELLEWSLVPVPANQEALRLAVKAIQPESDVDFNIKLEAKDAISTMQFVADEFKAGRVLSARNEARIRDAVQLLDEVLEQLEDEPIIQEPDGELSAIAITTNASNNPHVVTTHTTGTATYTGDPMEWFQQTDDGTSLPITQPSEPNGYIWRLESPELLKEITYVHPSIAPISNEPNTDDGDDEPNTDETTAKEQAIADAIDEFLQATEPENEVKNDEID